MPMISLIVEDCSPLPCNPLAIFSLTIDAIAPSTLTGITVIPGVAVTGELDVNLGWFMLTAQQCQELANLLNGANGTVIEVTYKEQIVNNKLKKIVTKVTYRAGNTQALANIQRSVTDIQKSLKDDVSKPVMQELRKLNENTTRILEILTEHERGKSDYNIKSSA